MSGADLPLTMLMTEHESARLHEQLLADMDQITNAWDRKAEGAHRLAEPQSELVSEMSGKSQPRRLCTTYVRKRARL